MTAQGWNPAEMPRKESEHELRGPQARPEAVGGPSERAPRRARQGEHVLTLVEVIKPDKRDEWERLVAEVVRPNVARAAPEVAGRLRYLRPEHSNADGTWTYLFVVDPAIEGLDCRVGQLTVAGADPAIGDEVRRLWDVCHAQPESDIEVVQAA